MTQIIAYFIIITYALIQELFIRHKSARSFRRKTKIDVTTVVYVSAIILCLASAPLLNSLGLLELSGYTSWIGLIVLLIGIMVRLTAMRQLGKFYTRALGVTKKQKLMTSGLYSYVRHPGYTGTIMAATGFGLAQGNLMSFAFIIILMTFVYVFRIRDEEKILSMAFGEAYVNYARNTKRLIPFVF